MRKRRLSVPCSCILLLCIAWQIRLTIRTHEAAICIIDKKGALNNPADGDHCMLYMVVVALIHGRLTAVDYEEEVACDARIVQLRDKIVCVEDPQFTKDYHDPDKRAIANGMTIVFNDGTVLDGVVVEYPVGQQRRRDEGLPLLEEKFKKSLAKRFSVPQQQVIIDLCSGKNKLGAMPVNKFVNMFCDDLI